MKKKIFIGTVTSVFVIFSILSVNPSLGSSTDTDLRNIKIMSQANATVNPDCPNGCLENGAGCRCNGWHPHYLEYGSLDQLLDL